MVVTQSLQEKKQLIFLFSSKSDAVPYCNLSENGVKQLNCVPISLLLKAFLDRTVYLVLGRSYPGQPRWHPQTHLAG